MWDGIDTSDSEELIQDQLSPEHTNPAFTNKHQQTQTLALVCIWDHYVTLHQLCCCRMFSHHLHRPRIFVHV